MARTTEQNQKLVNDFLSAFHAANPDCKYVAKAEYVNGWMHLDQDGYRTKHRPTKVEEMITRLRARMA
jgi:hypothetical protein